MHAVYNFVSGPLVWVSFILFFGGSIYRIVSMAQMAKKTDPVVYHFWSLKYAMRSISHWIIPFASENMRKHPAMTIVTFAFHICLFIAPLFLFAHIILFKASWNISWIYLPDTVADVMTWIVIGACIFFLVRRLTQPEVKYVTSFSDYVILAIVAAPFITGFWTYHQWVGFRIMGIAHILSGEIMLAAIPFTRLSHMLFFPFTRGYTGSEFGGVKHARDW